MRRTAIYGFCATVIAVCVLSPTRAQDSIPTLTRIATGLQNPRGVAVLADGRLLVGEAGTGFVGDESENTGKVSTFADLNGDGDTDDVGERTTVIDHLPGYNILYQFNPGRDEIVGVGDVLALPDGRALFTLDDNFQKLAVVALSSQLQPAGDLVVSEGTLNALAYDPQSRRVYVAESSVNALGAVRLDDTMPTLETVVQFGLLAHNQQAVPAGLAVDPLTGDVLVALFSGQLWDYYGAILSFMPGDSKIVRVNPETGAINDEITGLTTAIDVAVDTAGNRYVLEMTTRWSTPTLTHDFDLFDPDAPPDAGGYARFSGRLTLYPVDGGAPMILADDLDEPTNLTYDKGLLYISTGQGTPGRPIWGKGSLTRITGELYTLSVASFESTN